MYSVFIVDDEMLVREGLRNKIDWESSGFTFAGEAADGEIALSMIQDIKPDILISDIRMPFMDGLELASMAKKIQPWLRIIILSGHDEFDYAKRAISIGVDDYLLKPFTLEDVLSSLNKVAETLDTQKQQAINIRRAQEELESTASLSRTKLLTDLVYGTVDASSAIQQAQDFGINLISHYYAVSATEIHRSEVDNKELLLAFKSAILSLGAQQATQEHTIVFFLTPTIFVAIHKGTSAELCEEAAFSFANLVQHELSQQEKNTTLTTAIGQVVEHTSHIAHSFKSASSVIKKCQLTSRNLIISSNDLQEASDNAIVLQENDPLVDRLNYAGENEIDQIISEYIAMLGENRSHFSIIASYLTVDVIMAVSTLIERLGGDVKEVMPEILSHQFVERAVQTEDSFVSEIRSVLTALLVYRNEHVQGRYADLILRAKRYIDQNFASPDICLRSAAETVNLSPNHFSTVFSQDCGITFIEYLTRVRIEQAKKLLRASDMKSSDIAYEVGFSDPHYFSFIFKKSTGMSPREWRNSRNTET
ncbi:MAG: response regulator [Treponema sp.]|nr:response regulator [Treponema sp.]